MNIATISSNSLSSPQEDIAVEQDWKALQTDLQQGDLSSAMSAFSAMQKDIPSPAQAAEAKPPSADSLVGEALHALQTALQKVDVSGAQSALASLQSAIKTAYAQTAPLTPAPSEDPIASAPAAPPQALAGSTLNYLA
jgi:ribosomal protein S20